MSRNPIDQWNKCGSKKPWRKEEHAWQEAKHIMRKDLRQGFVHRMDVYPCKYSDPENPHYHVGTKQRPFAATWKGDGDTRMWAEEMGIKWTDTDEALAQAALNDEASIEEYWRKYREGRRNGY